MESVKTEREPREYRVVAVFKDRQDRITDLEITREALMKGEEYRHGFSSIVSTEKAMQWIKNGQIRLFTEEFDLEGKHFDRAEVFIKSVNKRGGGQYTYLTTERDDYKENNLDHLGRAQL